MSDDTIRCTHRILWPADDSSLADHTRCTTPLQTNTCRRSDVLLSVGVLLYALFIYWYIVYNETLLSGYKLLTVCIQVICLSMSISNFRRTSNAVCCKVILFPATGSPLSMKRYGGRLAHLRRSVTASLRRWVAIRLPLSASGAASCCPHHSDHTTFVTDLRHPLSTCRQLTPV